MVKREEFDQWVQDWIAREKAAGRKCFDVKKSGNSYYVYFQTTRYNNETKKREKVSGYLGKLVQGEGLVGVPISRLISTCQPVDQHLSAA